MCRPLLFSSWCQPCSLCFGDIGAKVCEAVNFFCTLCSASAVSISWHSVSSPLLLIELSSCFVVVNWRWFIVDDRRAMSSAKVKVFQHSGEVPGNSRSLFFYCMLHYPVFDDEEQETWHPLSVFDSRHHRKRGCDLVVLNYRALEIRNWSVCLNHDNYQNNITCRCFYTRHLFITLKMQVSKVGT